MRHPCRVTVFIVSSLACGPPTPPATVVVPVNDPTLPGLSLEVKVPNRQLLLTKPLSPPASSKVSQVDRVQMDAVAEDGDGGVKNVGIWYTVTKTVVDPATGVGTVTGPGLLGSPAASAPNPPEPRNPGDAAVVRWSAYTELLMFNQPTGNNTTLKYDIWATAENYRGGQVKTSVVTLLWP
jgi:hypothetical protein